MALHLKGAEAAFEAEDPGVVARAHAAAMEARYPGHRPPLRKDLEKLLNAVPVRKRLDSFHVRDRPHY